MKNEKKEKLNRKDFDFKTRKVGGEVYSEANMLFCYW